MSIERLAAVSLLALLDRDDPGRPQRLGGVRTPIGVDADGAPVDEHHGLLRTTYDPPVRFRCADLTTAQIDVLTRRLATAGPPVHSLWM